MLLKQLEELLLLHPRKNEGIFPTMDKRNKLFSCAQVLNAWL